LQIVGDKGVVDSVCQTTGSSRRILAYSYDDLVKDRKTSWSGIRNNLALIHLRSVRTGDLIFFYQTGGDKAIVGIMKSLDDAYSLDKSLPLSKSKEVAVDVAPLQKLARHVALSEMKDDARFKDFLLLKISRLSVMPVTPEQWGLILNLSSSK